MDSKILCCLEQFFCIFPCPPECKSGGFFICFRGIVAMQCFLFQSDSFPIRIGKGSYITALICQCEYFSFSTQFQPDLPIFPGVDICFQTLGRRHRGQKYRTVQFLPITFRHGHGAGKGRDQMICQYPGFLLTWPLKIQKNAAAIQFFRTQGQLFGNQSGIVSAGRGTVVQDQ